MNKHAVGIVCQDRWGLTYATLNSLYYCDQDKSKFDLYVIDNGSTEENKENLKSWMSGNLLPFNNLFVLEKQMSIPAAWNLFLAVTQDYEYRTKLDNDIVFMGTPNVPWDIEDVPTVVPTAVPDAGVNPGAIPSASIIRGPGQWVGAAARRKNIKRHQHSRFLDHMAEFTTRMNTGITALVVTPPKQPFMTVHNTLVHQRENGMPYLVGSCMMISKKAFDTLGYFDENLPRMIDIDYTQRAIEGLINIGYHDAYWAVHMGHNKASEGEDMKLNKIQKTRQLINTRGRLTGFVNSKWTPVIGSVMDQMDNKIIVMQ